MVRNFNVSKGQNLKTLKRFMICRKTIVLSCHRCIITTGIEKIEHHLNVGTQIIVYIFEACCFIARRYTNLVKVCKDLGSYLQQFIFFVSTNGSNKLKCSSHASCYPFQPSVTKHYLILPNSKLRRK